MNYQTEAGPFMHSDLIMQLTRDLMNSVQTPWSTRHATPEIRKYLEICLTKAFNGGESAFGFDHCAIYKCEFVFQKEDQYKPCKSLLDTKDVKELLQAEEMCGLKTNPEPKPEPDIEPHRFTGVDLNDGT